MAESLRVSRGVPRRAVTPDTRGVVSPPPPRLAARFIATFCSVLTATSAIYGGEGCMADAPPPARDKLTPTPCRAGRSVAMSHLSGQRLRSRGDLAGRNQRRSLAVLATMLLAALWERAPARNASANPSRPRLAPRVSAAGKLNHPIAPTLRARNG